MPKWSLIRFSRQVCFCWSVRLELLQSRMSSPNWLKTHTRRTVRTMPASRASALTIVAAMAMPKGRPADFDVIHATMLSTSATKAMTGPTNGIQHRRTVTIAMIRAAIASPLCPCFGG